MSGARHRPWLRERCASRAGVIATAARRAPESSDRTCPVPGTGPGSPGPGWSSASGDLLEARRFLAAADPGVGELDDLQQVDGVDRGREGETQQRRRPDRPPEVPL